MGTAEFCCRLAGRKVKVQEYPERVHRAHMTASATPEYFVVAHIFQKTVKIC